MIFHFSIGAKSEFPKDEAKAVLLAALSKKSPKEIAVALKEFEKTRNLTGPTKEDEELVKLAKAEQEESKRSSSI